MKKLTFQRIFRDFRTFILQTSGQRICCHLHTVLSTLNSGKLWVLFWQKESNLAIVATYLVVLVLAECCVIWLANYPASFCEITTERWRIILSCLLYSDQIPLRVLRHLICYSACNYWMVELLNLHPLLIYRIYYNCQLCYCFCVFHHYRCHTVKSSEMTPQGYDLYLN